MKVFRYLLFLLVVLVLFSCKKFKGAQEIPSYVRVEPWTLTTDYRIYGAATEAITDAWLYVDGNLLGCYEIQSHDDGNYVMIPVLEKGSHKLQMYPGIKLNGIASTRIQYPFYKPYVITEDLAVGETVTVNPSTVYYSIDSTMMRFEMKQDFEDINNMFAINADVKIDTAFSKAVLQQRSHRTDPDAWLDPFDTLNHYRSARVQLNDTLKRFRLASRELRGLPAVGNYVLLELDYKCDEDFLFGMFVHSSQEGLWAKELYYVRASDVWKKIYLNMSPTVTENYSADYFKFYFEGYGDGALTNFYFDNIKLIYRE